MPTYLRPGVYVEEILGASNTIGAATLSRAAFIAPHGRGPTEATYISSWSEYVSLFGGFGNEDQHLPFAVYAYFSNGGREAHVVRVIGDNIATASLTLRDRGTSVSDTLMVSAANPGSWGNRIALEVIDGASGRFDLVVRHGGVTNSHTVERWTDLSMDPTDARFVVSLINSVIAGSKFISVTNRGVNDALLSANPSPENIPAVLPPRPDGAKAVYLGDGTNHEDALDPFNTTLGNDGIPPTATQKIAGLQKMDSVLHPFTVNFPGEDELSNVVSPALEYASGRGDVFVVIDAKRGRQPADAVADAQSLTTSSYGAMYYPWIHVSDPASRSGASTRLVPPGGAVLGQYAANDASRGVHKAPAGLSYRIAGAVGLETRLTNQALDALNSSHVNAIRHMPGAGVCIMGARTLARFQPDRYITIRRSLIYVKHALREGTQWAAFEPNDHTLWTSLSNHIDRFLSGFWQEGGLRGNSPTEAFYVKCDEQINTQQVIDSGEVRVEVGVALQYPAEFVIIRVGQWYGGSSATEITDIAA